MRLSVFMFLLYLFLGSAAARAAAPAEARELARNSNCPPKKIEVYRHTLGKEGRTVYSVECNLPKTKDESAAQTASSLLIQCEGNLCVLLRPVAQTQ